jgi:transcription elongation factor GreA
MKQYITKSKHNSLISEVESLKTEGRRRVASLLRQAKALGDLSENSDYQEAREQQTALERRIHELEEVVRNSEVIQKKSGIAQVIEVGSLVKMKKGKDEIEYTIVGSHEAKPSEGLISNESPIGQALLGKKVGETVLHKTPSGEVKYMILEIG